MLALNVQEAKREGVLDSHLCRNENGLLFISEVTVTFEEAPHAQIESMWVKDCEGKSYNVKPSDVQFQILGGWE